MTVLVQPDTIRVMQPTRTPDEHGWVEEDGLTQISEIKGTVQQAPPIDDPRASENGGFGPTAPYHLQKGTAYLSHKVEPGDVLLVLGNTGTTEMWRVQNVRLVEDPRSGGHLNCWVAEVSQREVWV